MSNRSRDLSKTDPGWKYASCPDSSKLNTLKCNICKHVSTGEIFRMKIHLSHMGAGVRYCQKVPREVRDEIRTYMLEKKSVKNSRDGENRVVDLDDEDADAHEASNNPCLSKISSSTGTTMKGPMDLYLGNHSEVTSPKRKMQRLAHLAEDNTTKQELRARACKKIAQWMYDAGIPFNAVNYDSFSDAVDAIGRYGAGMKPPSFHELREPLLKNEVKEMDKKVEEHRVEWKNVGCSIMCDGWKDRRERTLIKFLVNSPKGSLFIESVDGSDYSKTGDKMHDLIKGYVDDVGKENVVQVVTDSASNNVKAGKMLMSKYPLFWTPCAAHCLDLMLEDIFKIPKLKKAYANGVSLCGYIYSRTGTVNMLRKFTKLRELLRPARTRFASATIMFTRLHKQKNNLRKMFILEEWNESKWSKEPGGKKVTSIVLRSSFWNNIVFALKVSCPLVEVLRMVDGEAKPVMGYIYGAMERAKTAIGKAFEEEYEYGQVFEIIDKRWETQLHQPLHAAGYYLNPGIFYDDLSITTNDDIVEGFHACIDKLVRDSELKIQILEETHMYHRAEKRFASTMAKSTRKTWAPARCWESFGSSTPNLQKFAIKVLSLTCSASGCERNWSMFEHIHSKKRNRLTHERLNNLVYVKYNRALQRRYEKREQIDPILLETVDESNEWLIGCLDDDEEVDDDLVHENGSYVGGCV